MKKCNKCKETKNVSNFYKNKSKKDGLQYMCKECGKACSIKWSKNNPEKVKVIANNWKKNNPEKVKAYSQLPKVKTSKKASNAKSYINNKEKVNKRAAIWHKNNPEKVKAFAAKHKYNNPEAILKSQIKHINKLGKEFNFTLPEMKLALFYWSKTIRKLDNNMCKNCDSIGVILHAHHIQPKARFPKLSLILDNEITLCVPCHNTMKYS